MGITLREILVVVGAVIIICIVIFYRSGEKTTPRDKSSSKRQRKQIKSKGKRIEPRLEKSPNIVAEGMNDIENIEDYTDFLTSADLNASDLMMDDAELDKQSALSIERESSFDAEEVFESDISTVAVEPEVDLQEAPSEIQSPKKSKRFRRREQEEQPVVEESDSPQDVIVMTLVSKNNGFEGPELLQVAIACGLRFGDMGIFHRYANKESDGKVLFSMANAVQPGTFDLDLIEQFSTLGITFFMTMPGPKDLLNTFNLMLETVNHIAKKIDGELLDEQRNPLTKQMLEHYRQRVVEFERRQLSKR